MIELHDHLDTSNFRLLDCTISVKELIQTAADMGKKGVAITDHETVAAHVKAIQTTRQLKEDGKIPQDFKLILGMKFTFAIHWKKCGTTINRVLLNFLIFCYCQRIKRGMKRYVNFRVWPGKIPFTRELWNVCRQLKVIW